MSRFRRRLMALSTLKPQIKDEFVRVEYIENTSNAYIDTKIVSTIDDEVSITVSTNDFVESFLCGARSNKSSMTNSFFIYGQVKEKVAFATNNGYTVSSVNIQDGDKHTVQHNKEGGFIDGQKVVSRQFAEKPSNRSYYIFTINDRTTPTSISRFKLYKFTYSRNGSVIMDLVPVLNKGTNKYGMYDLVKQKFYTSPNGAKFVGGKEIIYDAEIEYLESTGTQWIDTGVYQNEGQSYAIDIIATPTKDESDFIATRIGNGGMVVGFYNYFVFGYNRPNSRIDIGKFEVKETELHIEYEFKDGNRTLTVNGISYIGEGATYSANSTIRIYGGYQGVYYSSIKCKRVVFRNTNNNLLIDMIPVRVGNVGYMYDKVSGKLFGNSGSGNFILGKDVEVYDKI